MPEQPGEKSKYKSSGGAYISANQSLAEKMCERIAARSNIALPYKYWEIPQWKKEFLRQLRLVNGLLKIYSPEAIFRALRTKEARNIHSFAASFLVPIIQEEEKKLVAEKARLAEAKSLTPADLPVRPTFSKPSLLTRLKDLDGSPGNSGQAH